MNSHDVNSDMQQIWDTLLVIDNALVQKDAAVFEKLLSADFVGAIPTGAYFKKEAYIHHHCNINFGVISLTEDHINASSIRLYNDTAVVNRRVHAHFKLPAGNIIEYDVQRIEVLVKISDRWVMVSGQGTQVMPMAQPK
ncbi:MAG TPA: nuclear transport factor 2 family protein [Agriterribacter sp.]|nr:nuclear transport factor 2 family protein [Agriterribacter sp.]